MARVIVVVALGWIVAPRLALAQADHAAPSAETQALLREALAEYDRGNYAEAYSLFTRVHESSPTARTERALGNCAFELRQYREAITWLEAALEDARNPLTAEMRTEAEGVLARARGFVGRFTVTANVDGATIDVDGEPLRGGAILLEVGAHEVIASAAGYVTVTRRIAVRGGEDETVAITLHASGEPAEVATVPPTAAGTAAGGLATPTDRGGGGENVAESWWLWTIVGVVVVGAGVGIGVGVAVGSGTTVEAPLVPPGGLVMALVGR